MAPIEGYAWIRVAQTTSLAAMARGIDRPISWSRPKVADLKASSDIAERGLTCRTSVVEVR